MRKLDASISPSTARPESSSSKKVTSPNQGRVTLAGISHCTASAAAT